MEYKKAMVFFIDILGTKDRDSFEELYKINLIFHKELEVNKTYDNNHPNAIYERTIHTFSDCAYIIYDFKDGVPEEKKDITKLFNVALCNTQRVILSFLKNNFLCRGGVTYGDIYYEKERSLLFGPAVNKAYMFESNEAKYPRILVDDFIADKIINYNNILFKKIKASKDIKYEILAIDKIESNPEYKMFELINPMFKQDLIESLIKSDIGQIVTKDKNDGKYFLNYFDDMLQGINKFENEQLIKSLQILITTEKNKQLQKINFFKHKKRKKCVRKKINQAKRVLEKYIWIEEYLNESKGELYEN